MLLRGGGGSAGRRARAVGSWAGSDDGPGRQPQRRWWRGRGVRAFGLGAASEPTAMRFADPTRKGPRHWQLPGYDHGGIARPQQQQQQHRAGIRVAPGPAVRPQMTRRSRRRAARAQTRRRSAAGPRRVCVCVGSGVVVVVGSPRAGLVRIRADHPPRGGAPAGRGGLGAKLCSVTNIRPQSMCILTPGRRSLQSNHRLEKLGEEVPVHQAAFDTSRSGHVGENVLQLPRSQPNIEFAE